MRPGDILGALTAHADITGAVVGKIDLLDQSTFVAVHAFAESLALQQLNHHKVKGRMLRARRIS